MDKCPSRRFGGHRFEPRYDKTPPDLRQFSEITGLTTERLEKFRKVTYVRDICIHCGKAIERQS